MSGGNSPAGKPIPSQDSSPETELPAESSSLVAETAAEPIVLEITDVLDLHVFTPRDVAVVVPEYLEQARSRGFLQVRIIHGKGIGVQRELVRSILRRTSFVVHYEEASGEAGGWGATVAWLQGPGSAISS